MGAASIVDRKFATFCNIASDIETYVKCRGIYGHLCSKWWQNKQVGITQLHTDTQGLDFDANQRIDSRRDSRHTIAARIKVDWRERYHD